MKYRYREPHEMKDSGVEWLGMIPREWERTALKNLVKTKITDGPHETPELKLDGIPFLSAEAIVIDKISISNMRGYISKEQYDIYAKKSKVYKNDILFCKSGSTTGKSALVETDEIFGIWSPLAIIRADDRKITYKNLFYVIQSRYFRTQVENYWSFGTQPNIGMAVLENLYVPFSNSKQEQQKIANFLDLKCGEFDSIIEKKESLITKLEEAKKSLISEVVTGKVKVIEKENGSYEIEKREPHEMKDSGVEWLGMIPREWGGSYLRYYIELLTDYTANGSFADLAKNVKYLDSPDYARLIRLTDLRKNLENQDGVYVSVDSYNYLQKSSLFGGELLIANVGAYSGYTFKVPSLKIPGTLAPNMFLIKLKKSFEERFIYWLFVSDLIRLQLINKAQSAAQPKLNKEDIRNTRILIPEYFQQQKIADFLDLKCSQFDSTIEKQKGLIEKLKKAKQSLISEAVTGKIEVL